MTTTYVHSEAQLETLFRVRVRNVLGGKVDKLSATRGGIPDRLVILPLNRIYVVELKTATGKLDPLQVEWHRTAKRLAPRLVYVLHGLSEIDAWISDRAREYDALFDTIYGKD
jgi:hypothetical protein